MLLLAGTAAAVLPCWSQVAEPQVAEPQGGVPAAGGSERRVSTATTGLVTIESDQQRADNRTGVITATGNVRIVYPDQRVVATARQAQYFSQEGRVILSGDVDIVQTDGNAMRAERVIYDLNSERLLAQPPAGQQVFSKVRIPARQGAAAE
ncbi:MAG: LptA/OstA family protein [Cyanobacteriota bacterium]|nr:LptA/OstA family protein [Cyanobacteriota bacterium]